MSLAENCRIIKSLLRASCTGITPKKLIEEAKRNGVDRPLNATRHVVREGLARVDHGKKGRPTRIKATPKLFEET